MQIKALIKTLVPCTKEDFRFIGYMSLMMAGFGILFGGLMGIIFGTFWLIDYYIPEWKETIGTYLSYFMLIVWIIVIYFVFFHEWLVDRYESFKHD